MIAEDLAREISTKIYAEKIYSPFSQLLLIEDYLEGNPDITYTKLRNELKKQTKGIKTCISCLKDKSKPCHLIDTDNYALIRKSRKQISPSRGNKEGTRKSDTEKLTEIIIEAIAERHELREDQEYNLKESLRHLKIELLVMIAGGLIPVSIPVGVSNPPNEPDWVKNYYDETDEILKRAIFKLLPEREKDFIEKLKRPKPNAKLDLRDYMVWWKTVSLISRNFPNAFKEIKDKDSIVAQGSVKVGTDTEYWKDNYSLHYYLMRPLPIPCKEDPFYLWSYKVGLKDRQLEAFSKYVFGFPHELKNYKKRYEKTKKHFGSNVEKYFDMWRVENDEYDEDYMEEMWRKSNTCLDS
jgi:hypothetical protein